MADHQKEIEEFGNNDDFWLFGYGSLIWKPPPHFDQRIPGYIEGYVRRFWQASEDHRGTPEAPGRVVTLIDKAHWETLTDHHELTEKVWGAAYHIPSSKVAEVREYLDIREINGYSIQFAPFQPAAATTATALFTPNAEPADSYMGIRASTTTSVTSSDPVAIRCLVYIGLPSNPQFLGPQDPDALAKKILDSTGPSGANKEYLYNLEKALSELSKESKDAHISELAKKCRELEGEGGGKGGSGVDGGGLRRAGSTEEQEEVEK